MLRLNRTPLAAVLLFALLAAPRPAHATSKEIIELQTQVQQLLDMVQRMQSTLDTRFGVLQHLVEQSTDTVNKMGVQVTAMQQKLNTDADASNSKVEGVSGQVQSLNDSLDELKARIAKLDKQLQDIQGQLQTLQPPAPPAGTAPGATDGSQPAGATTPQAPPLQETYQGALRDYNAAHYDVAGSEFADVIHYYPHEDLAGNAQFYLGEIAYHQNRYKDAVKAYNDVIENFSGNPKAPAAQLRKGFALLQLGQKEPGVHELRSLIQRYPQSPEAAQARTKLNGLGVRINPR